MAVIHIDGKTVEVDSADNLLQACLSLGIDIPYFCYHPALGSVGSCRQCAVKQYNNAEDYAAGRGRLVMSCMVAPTNDMYISVDDDEAKAFRKRIVEYIMTNHPHDCPTCEEGGHCHLQDMTYMSGHRERRYRFTKRTHHNQDLGPFINHEMNRCIACYRCVRFYKDYAGGEDMGVYASNNRVYFGREADGQFESEFSGNLTEVCPTGVFTDATHSDRYNRKWDMQYAPSVCHGCSTGCNISAGERYGELRRIENRYNHDVNGYFLCDRGRFGYGYVNRADRPLTPCQNTANGKVALTADAALDTAIELLKGKKAIGIGSDASSIENNFALKKLVGADNYSTGQSLATQSLIDKSVQILRNDSVYNVSVAQIEQADAVFILGEDITQTSARVALSVRQAAKNKAKDMATALRTEHWLAEPVKRIGQNANSPIYVVDVVDTKLDDIAKVSAVATIEDVARLGYLVGEVIETFGTDLDRLAKPSLNASDEMLDLAYQIAKDLITANQPLVISGASLSSSHVIDAAGFITTALTKKRQAIKAQNDAELQAYQAQVDALNAAELPEHDPQLAAKPEHEGTNTDKAEQAQLVRIPEPKALDKRFAPVAGIYLALPAANSAGLSLLGGKSIEEVLASDFEVAVVLENDLSQLASINVLGKLHDKTVIVIDHQNYPWHDGADLVLSASSFAESDGTLVSAEGRAQRFFQAYDKKYYEPTSEIKDAWRWLYALGFETGKGASAAHLDEVIDDIGNEVPALANIKAAAPNADYRITGLKIAREPRRYSGRTAMRAPLSIHEPMQPKDLDTALTFSMEGYVGNQTNPASIPFAWAAGWNSPQAWNKYQDKVGGKLKGGDVGVRLFDILPRLDTTYHSHRTEIQDPASTSVFNGIVRLVPVHNIFSSSPMASRSPVVAGQIKPIGWYVNEEDANHWQVREGDLLSIQSVQGEIVLPVLINEFIPEGCIGYAAGQVPLSPKVPTTIKRADSVDPVYQPAYQLSVQNLPSRHNNPLFKASDTPVNVAPSMEAV
ncbi:NADH-quinone oxidoreductase subunit NuoG [Moraxella sp. FZLJ2107]|uniref:NADH-quinone oxidoreductase subunit NuoG n=1 Tax=unclassified Moraxella TaxID=2685852 RepID=UPI0020C845CF|nr:MULTISPECIES: NADH-quinone oxidoreductase subunit NuoG [unclassified Moraxella]UTO05189.1 NADH-quinone oxidoreductase subunit NuoG [Moraxella sp. FZLJ2107]UTO21924.1 NADH-quinone oxidoreductase subunit NuoG [Moraxella sp. FZLJ2109]